MSMCTSYLMGGLSEEMFNLKLFADKSLEGKQNNNVDSQLVTYKYDE